MNLDRDFSIIAQVAAKAATELSVAEIAAGNAFDSSSWKARTRAIFQQIIEVAGGAVPAADPVAVVTEAFPGAQVVAQPTPAAQPVSQPAPAGGFLAQCGIQPHQLSTSGDEKLNLQAHVADLDANPNNWYDNRFNKRNPKGPDFKNKTSGVALWVRS